MATSFTGFVYRYRAWQAGRWGLGLLCGPHHSPAMMTAAAYASRARRVGIMSAIRRVSAVGGDEDDEARSAAAAPAPPTATDPSRYPRYGVLVVLADA